MDFEWLIEVGGVYMVVVESLFVDVVYVVFGYLYCL